MKPFYVHVNNIGAEQPVFKSNLVRNPVKRFIYDAVYIHPHLVWQNRLKRQRKCITFA